ncbi:TonB-dependent receptor plug domain-containing protein [Elizabethkingia argentiflava]|uniref:TonB-dependent receptor plug domain-containing protein n=1 Tax=Elizabethkingia argenteiflava TaxID=2681556 RepID=A0A845PXP6_9FLAO|nr:TonB-dependent receptor [Elizabethkingia argenteiflava]NAW52013.1 TonB-dependent receptor plug domain-containing protein [Elizabethkingia argenteiflava]
MKINFKKPTLALTLTLTTASLCYTQQKKDSVTSKSREIETLALRGITDIAKDRKTPVAVSTLKEAHIVERLGNQEFPEILNTTPSVYTTKGGGGFGDSKLNIRGFNQENIAVMVNGMPVNDMETGSVYWSNWAGLSDVTSAMQVQRGLGSSKLAIASVGGTVNVLTRAADKKRGGKISVGLGNDGYVKNLFSYNTGKSEEGWSSSFLMSRTSGNMYADGTQFEANTYYFALGYQPNKKHDFQFTITGAPQWHNQRRFAIPIGTYLKYGKNGDPNRKYNSDWGYLNGREYSMAVNYYHKPVMSLNWDWSIDDRSKINTIVYASFGRGGGTNMPSNAKVGGQDLRNFRNPETGLYDLDALYQANKNSTPEQGNIIRNVSINSHDWYGVISSFNHKINHNLNLTVGIDGRYYYGYHYQLVSDLLGASGYIDHQNLNTPHNLVSQTFQAEPSWNPFGGKINKVKDRIGYSNDGKVIWYGGFSQLEYSTSKISAFIQGSLSNQGFQRIDNFIKDGVTKSKNGEIMHTKTDFKYHMGFNVKAGLNYNINRQHNIFGNIGYYQKQPFFNAVYRSNENIVSKDLTNEKILGAELGYGFRSKLININANLYRTSWDDRYMRRTNIRQGDTNVYAEINNLNEIHQGAEIDANYQITPFLSLNGMFSIGDWYYKGNARALLFNKDSNEPVNYPDSNSNEATLYLDKVKVGESAQTTAAIGLTLKPLKDLSFDTNWRSVNNLYAKLDPHSFMNPEYNAVGALKLPSFNLFDAGLSYKFNINEKQYFTMRANVYNVFDKIYIAESNTNTKKTLKDFKDTPSATAQKQLDDYNANPNNFYQGIDISNQVIFGYGRTWAATIAFNF